MKRTALLLVVLSIALETGCGYYLSESSDDLAVLESTPGVSIVYPSSMGPEVENKGEVKLDKDELDASASEMVTTMAPSGAKAESTTTQESTTTVAAEARVTTQLSDLAVLDTAESNITATVLSPATTTTTTTTEKPVSPSTATATVARASGITEQAKPGVNRIWHFNNQGLNTNAVWFSASRNEDANAASRASPVYANRFGAQQPSASELFVRKPIMAPEAEESGSASFARRMLTFSPAVGEYAAASREAERTLYYPEINRIRAPVATSSVGVSAGASASAAAAASASSASSSSSSSSSQEHATSSSSNSYKFTSSNANYWNAAAAAASGTKGGAGKYYESKTTIVQSPAKTVRKVVKTGKSLVERERLTETIREPVRVRVVVQQPAVGVKTTQVSQTNVNRLERLQDDSKTSYFGTKALANEYNSASASAAAAASASASAGVKTIETTKTSRLVLAGSKSPPPPPRVAGVKTVSSTKTIVRAPLYEQVPQRYEEPEQPEPEPYSFNFKVDDNSGNGQFRREEQDANGVVRGSYGYTDAWGLYRIVDYVADANGFRANIRSNEPGLVEKNPVTNAVDEPAHIRLAAEDTPLKVVELMRLPRHQPQL